MSQRKRTPWLQKRKTTPGKQWGLAISHQEGPGPALPSAPGFVCWWHWGVVMGSELWTQTPGWHCKALDISPGQVLLGVLSNRI
jgi:hypothetical protein